MGRTEAEAILRATLFLADERRLSALILVIHSLLDDFSSISMSSMPQHDINDEKKPCRGESTCRAA
jgi:hypothetical protein